MNKQCPGVKIILTGQLIAFRCQLTAALKCDLRQDPADVSGLGMRGEQSVSYDEGFEAARKLKASRYLGKQAVCPADPECSAKLNRGVHEAIHEAAQVSLSTRAKGGPRRSLPGCCVIL